MCVETLITGTIFPRRSIWGVTGIGLLKKWRFSYLSHDKSAILDHYMWEAMWNCHSWPLHVSGHIKLSFLTTKCLYTCAIAILGHKMSVDIWNCHPWPLDDSRHVKILFWTTRCKYPGKTDFSSYLSLVSVYISAVSPGRAEIWEMLTVVVMAVL